MVEFQKLTHPVDDEEFIDYLKSYAAYLQEAIDARNRGDNVDEIIDDINEQWKTAGLLDKDGYIVPEYTRVFKTLGDIIDGSK